MMARVLKALGVVLAVLLGLLFLRPAGYELPVVVLVAGAAMLWKRSRSKRTV